MLIGAAIVLAGFVLIFDVSKRLSSIAERTTPIAALRPSVGVAMRVAVVLIGVVWIFAGVAKVAGV